MHIMILASAENVHTVRWVNKLTEQGHEITLVSCPDHNLNHKNTKEINSSVKLIELPFSTMQGLGYFLNAQSCARIAKQHKPDVVNAHYASGYGTLARMAKLRPLALSVWGSEVFTFPDKSPLHKKLITSNLKYADIVLSTSETMANRVRQLLSDPTRRIPVTPFGVDLENFTSKKHDRENVYNVSIGIIKSHKKAIYGIETLLSSTKLLKKRYQDEGRSLPFHLHIYGDGPARLEFESITSRLDLNDCVTFHGSIANTTVPDALRKMDIYVIPSLNESFGVAAVEAMAAGLPIASSDAPGLKEVVTNNVTGIIVPAGNEVELAGALQKLIENPVLREKLGRAGREDVRNRFQFSQNAHTLVEALQSIRFRGQ